MRIWDEMSTWDYARMRDVHKYADKKYKPVIDKAMRICPYESNTLIDHDNKVVFFMLNEEKRFTGTMKLLKITFGDNGDIQNIEIVKEDDRTEYLYDKRYL